MKRSKKLDRIHSLLVLLFSIICITGAVFLCYDKCVVAYICWFVCILIVPCACVLHFEYRSANGDIRFKTSYEPDRTVCFEDLDKFLGYSSFAINKYGERILKALEE